jgi:hypothetical protein
MKSLAVIIHLARADFFERIRRRSFWIILAITVMMGYLFVPPLDAGYRVLQVGLQRGIYNSPWIGLMFGLIAALHLSLVGFFLVKNAVDRDRQTGVGQIIAATPISKLTYVVGKWLSNLAVLMLILSVLTLMAVVMQMVRAEETLINLWKLAAPIWLMGVPIVAIAAALAVFFESVSFLSAGFGNVVFFFLWLFTLGVVMTNAIDETTDRARVIPDPYGYTRQLVDVQAQVLASDPEAEVDTGLIHVGKPIEGTFAWDGIHWSVGTLMERLVWASMALVVAFGASIPFDRFDPARRRLRLQRTGLYTRLHEWFLASAIGEVLGRKSVTPQDLQADTSARLTSFVVESRQGRFFSVLVAELKLMLKGQSFFWYIVAIGLVFACLFSPISVMQQYLLLGVWIWPVMIWSQMGVREMRFNTWQMVFSTPRLVLRQAPALWLAGVIVSIFIGSGALIRLVMVGDFMSAFAWLVGALFTPALALTLGTWIGNARAFEFIYLFWWYIGLGNRVPSFDYVGMTVESQSMGMPFVYSGITMILLVLAVLGRRRQLRT